MPGTAQDNLWAPTESANNHEHREHELIVLQQPQNIEKSRQTERSTGPAVIVQHRAFNPSAPSCHVASATRTLLAELEPSDSPLKPQSDRRFLAVSGPSMEAGCDIYTFPGPSVYIAGSYKIRLTLCDTVNKYTSCTIYSELFHVHSPARGMGGTPNEAKLTSWPPQPIPSGSLEGPFRGGRQRFSREMGRQSRGGQSMDTPPAAGPQPGRSKQILPRRPLTSTVPGELPQAALTFPLPAIEQPTVDVGIPWPPVRSDQRSGEGGQHARARESHPPTSHPPPLVPGLPMVGSQTNQNVDIRPSVDHPPAPSSGDNALSAYIPSFYTMFPQSSHIHIRSSTSMALCPTRRILVSIYSVILGIHAQPVMMSCNILVQGPTPPVLSARQVQQAVTQGSVDPESSTLRNSIDESAKSMDIFKEDLSAVKEDLSAIKEELSTVKEELNVVKEELSTKEGLSTAKEGLSQKRERLRDGFNVRERVQQIEARFGTS